MVGDAQIGKTSLMVKYIEGKFDEDYIQTLGKTLFSFFFFFVHPQWRSRKLKQLELPRIVDGSFPRSFRKKIDFQLN